MRKTIALLVALVMCAMLMVSCGKEDPLNRVEAYIEVDMQDRTVECYGNNAEAYMPRYSTTKAEVEAQSVVVENAIEKYILDKIPDEEVGKIFYYVEQVEGEGYSVTVLYQSLKEDDMGYRRKGDYYYHKVYLFTICADDDENQDVYNALKWEKQQEMMRIAEMSTRIATSFLLLGGSGN